MVVQKNTTILGNGYTIDFGTDMSNGSLRVSDNAELSLGRENPQGNENQLTLTVNLGTAGKRSTALLIVGLHNSIGTLNLYDGIRISGTKTNGASVASAINISNGTVNMYGGEISGNSIVSQDQNLNGYGGGLLLYSTEAHLYGGSIINNKAKFGGGIHSEDSDIIVEKDVILTDNQAATGGGLCNQDGRITVNSDAVIANNTADVKGDDIAHYGEKLQLSSAKDMSVSLTTDHSDKRITGWYEDEEELRWSPSNAHEKDVSQEIGEESVFLKAAYEEYSVSYRFVSGTTGKELPDEVLALLPGDKSTYELDATVNAIQPAQIAMKVSDGVWTFEGYDADSKVVDSNVEFTGTWTFKPNEVPVIHAKDIELTVDDTFDVMAGVIASDPEDGDLTEKIVVTENTVDTSRAGVYKVTYSVTDSNGVTVTKTIMVTVKEKKVPTEPVKPDGSSKPTTPDKTSPSGNLPKNADVNKIKAAQTGDATNLILWAVVLMLSGVVAVVFAGKKVKK